MFHLYVFHFPKCFPRMLNKNQRLPAGVQLTSMQGGLLTFLYLVTYSNSDRFSDVLKYVAVPFTDTSNCTEQYKKQRVRLGVGQLCAGGRKGEDSCSGDSGSALMLEVTSEKRPYDPRVTQARFFFCCFIDSTTLHVTKVGIVSFGPRRCASKGVPAIYTKVDQSYKMQTLQQR